MPRFFKQGGARRGGRLADIFLGARRAVALLAAAGPARAAAESARRPAPSGQIALAAGLNVDGMPAVAGQTVFPGSSFDTAENSRSALELGNRARLELSGGTALRLEFSDESLGGALGAGATRVSVPRRVRPGALHPPGLGGRDDALGSVGSGRDARGRGDAFGG